MVGEAGLIERIRSLVLWLLLFAVALRVAAGLVAPALGLLAVLLGLLLLYRWLLAGPR